MALIVTSDVIATLLAEAARAAPEECCGLLLGSDVEGGECIVEVCPAANVAANPRTRFEIDPAALLSAHRQARQGGRQVLGYFHSHPAGHPLPSATDCEHASGDGRVWGIVADGAVGFWRDGADGFEPIDCTIADGLHTANSDA